MPVVHALPPSGSQVCLTLCSHRSVPLAHASWRLCNMLGVCSQLHKHGTRLVLPIVARAVLCGHFSGHASAHVDTRQCS